MLEFIYDWLVGQGVGFDTAVSLARWLSIGLTILLSIFAYFLFKYIVLPLIFRSIKRSESFLDDILIERQVLNSLIYLAPALVIYYLAPSALDGYAPFIAFTTSIVLIYVIIVVLMTIRAFLSALIEMYYVSESSPDVPIKSFVQMVQIIIYFVAGILILAVLLNQSPVILLSGMGAVTAVLLFIFNDSLLGLVAGVQLTANKMVARGDWIDMPKYDASGEVLEIALTTVKVRNTDQSITTIPTHALIGESFKNWRGIQETNARRIKRAVFIDISSVQFCSGALLGHLKNIPAFVDYAAEQGTYLKGLGKGVTNLGAFRTYLTVLLRQHPRLYVDKTLLVRQLAPTAQGLPLEIYVYSKEVNVNAHENLQAELFEHILAVAPEFGLRIYQQPSGIDLQALGKGSGPHPS